MPLRNAKAWTDEWYSSSESVDEFVVRIHTEAANAVAEARDEARTAGYHAGNGAAHQAVQKEMDGLRADLQALQIVHRAAEQEFKALDARCQRAGTELADVKRNFDAQGAALRARHDDIRAIFKALDLVGAGTDVSGSHVAVIVKAIESRARMADHLRTMVADLQKVVAQQVHLTAARTTERDTAREHVGILVRGIDDLQRHVAEEGRAATLFERVLFECRARIGSRALDAYAKGGPFTVMEVAPGEIKDLQALADAATKTRPATALLQEAVEIVSGPRAEAYGRPADNFATIAGLWTLFWERRQARDATQFTPGDVAAFMVLTKVARLANSPDHYDSVLDIAGYAATWADCQDAARKDKA